MPGFPYLSVNNHPFGFSLSLMANIEEQSEELEVLASIYPTEFELSPDNDRHFKILLRPDPDGDNNHVSVSLVVEMPPEYPSDAGPITKVERVKGLSDSQLEEVQQLVDTTATENLGMPSVFTISEAVKEWLVDNNVAGQDGSMYSDMMRRMQQKDTQQRKLEEKEAIKQAADSEFQDKESVDPAELERIRKRQAGTAVTEDTFYAWKKKFDAEMALKELERIRTTGSAAESGAGGGTSMAALTSVTIGSTGTSSSKTSAGGTSKLTAVEEQLLRGEGRPTGKQFFLLGMGSTSGAGTSSSSTGSGKGGGLGIGSSGDMALGSGEEDPDAELDEDYDGEIFMDPEADSHTVAAAGTGRTIHDFDFGDDDDDDDEDGDYVDEEDT